MSLITTNYMAGAREQNGSSAQRHSAGSHAKLMLVRVTDVDHWLCT